MKYKKELMVTHLIDEDIEDIKNSKDNEYIFNLLFNGFKGYNNMTQIELKKECKARGL